jgi:hypothetical protein
MAPTGSLIPAQVDLQAVAGADFSATVVLYQDVAQTVAFDLTGYTCTFTVGATVLTSGSGLTITAGTGTIVVVLTATQTGALLGKQHYTLKLVDGGGLISYPLSGMLFVGSP